MQSSKHNVKDCNDQRHKTQSATRFGSKFIMCKTGFLKWTCMGVTIF